MPEPEEVKVNPTTPPPEPVKTVGPPPEPKPTPFELTVDRDAFLDELGLAAWCAEKRATQPILSAVLLTLQPQEKKKWLALQTTDLEVAFATRLPITASTGSGRVAVDAQLLLSACNAVTSDTLRLTFSGTAFTLDAGNAHFELPTFNPANFPVLPERPGGAVALAAEPLVAAIEHTRYGVSAEPNRYTMNGALLVIGAATNKLKMVATDGHRMPIYEHPVKIDKKAPDLQLIVPVPMLSLLPSALADASTVALAYNEAHLFFSAGKRQMAVRRMMGQFPQYEHVLPTDLPVRMECDRKELVACLRRVALVADERSNGVRLEFHPKSLVITTHSDAGSSTDKLAAATTGLTEPLMVGFDLRYLLDFVTSARTSRVALSVKAKDLACRFDIVPEEGVDYQLLCVIMPLRY